MYFIYSELLWVFCPLSFTYNFLIIYRFRSKVLVRNNKTIHSFITTNFAIQWCLIFYIIYWIFRWYLSRYYWMILIWCDYLVASQTCLLLNFFGACSPWVVICSALYPRNCLNTHNIQNKNSTKTCLNVFYL